ncbi:MAG: hypothetical protein H6662_18980 [Ardenticatenaceae bacterium]|nr:hypothetical protein [Ardenticatenaceae bacterium]
MNKQLGITVGDLAPGFGADLIVGGLWQAILVDGDLWQTNRELALRRTGHAAVVNATNGVIGAVGARGIGWFIAAVINVPDPSDLVVFPILVTVLVDNSIIGDTVSRIFEPVFGDLNINRDLSPLGQLE